MDARPMGQALHRTLGHGQHPVQTGRHSRQFYLGSLVGKGVRQRRRNTE